MRGFGLVSWVAFELGKLEVHGFCMCYGSHKLVSQLGVVAVLLCGHRVVGRHSPGVATPVRWGLEGPSEIFGPRRVS